VDGRTRRRLSGGIFKWSVAFAIASAPAALAAATSAPQTGVFALLDGSSKIVSILRTTPQRTPLSSMLHVTQFRTGSDAPILAYDVEMQHTMHLVVIRDDFATFAHLHPDFNTQTGTFDAAFTRAPQHRYYVYADSTPHGIGRQVFRFTIGSSASVAATAPAFAASAPSAPAGPYTVLLSKTAFQADTPASLDITVDKGTSLARDLGTYLGAAAHAVLIDTSTLQYVHVHPSVRTASGAMGAMNLAGPRMHVDLPALPAGTYKFWLQFRGGSYKVYTAAFTVVAH